METVAPAFAARAESVVPMPERFVRLATEDDLTAVGRLLNACVAAMRQAGIDQWDEIYPTEAILLSDIRAGTMHLASDRQGTLVGTVVLNEVQIPEWSQVAWTFTDGPILVVHRLMVAPTEQGHGAGRSLMEFTETWARANGYRAIRLDAFTANPRALRLYGGLAYRDAGVAMLRKGPFRCFEKRLETAR